MINKKKIHINSYSTFCTQKLSINSDNTKYIVGPDGEEEIEGTPDIPYSSVVFIKDTEQIWTHGKMYSCDTIIAEDDDSIEVEDIVLKDYIKYSGSTEYTCTIEPNKFYDFGEVETLTITLSEQTRTDTYYEYMFQFESGDTATTLSLPEDIKWYLDNDTILANKTYQISIVNNLAVLGEF